tara:strand:+ start:8955 stop:10151 length:1197 start_codon:yes stop_codon:yes gene_type:complete
MAITLNDRVKETTTSTGTGTINLAGAETGFESFVTGIGNGVQTYYAIVHQAADEFEIGIGTVTDGSPDTLSRTSIISSTNSDSAVNFSAGTKDVFCTVPAERMIFADNGPIVKIPFEATVGTGTADPLGLVYSGLRFAVNEQDASKTGSISINGGNAARIDFGVGGTALLRVYNDASNFTEFKRTTNHPIVFAVNNAETARFMSTELKLASGKKLTGGDSSGTGTDFTIQSDHRIEFISASKGTVIFKDQGTAYALLERPTGTNDLDIQNPISDGDITFVGNDGGSTITALTLDMSEAGAATFNDNVTAFSDERLKDNIETIENGLDKVEQLRGVTYTRDEKESIGVIAQEVEKILPEIVLTADDEMGTKSVDYSRLTAVLIEAVKDLSARVKELEDK